MSTATTDLVYEFSRSRRGSRLVMLALAREANDQGEVTLSMEDISKLTNLTPRAITNCLSDLSTMGELSYESEFRKGNPRKYAILLGARTGTATTSQGPTDNQRKGGSSFQEVSSGTTKSAQGKVEVSSSRTQGVNTPYGSINTSNKQASLLPRRSTAQQGSGSVSVPPGAQAVVAALESAGMLVGWRLSADEWERVTALAARWGTERLVEVIARRWDPARPPQSARYLLRIWDDLPSQVPAEASADNVVQLRRGPGWRPFRNPVTASAYENGF